MMFELWDIETFNLIETFDTEAAALAAARELIAVNGSIYPEALALKRWGSEDKSTWVAQGVALGRLAQGSASTQAAATRHGRRGPSDPVVRRGA